MTKTQTRPTSLVMCPCVRQGGPTRWVEADILMCVDCEKTFRCPHPGRYRQVADVLGQLARPRPECGMCGCTL
jgi:hypothetical protein